MRKVTQEELNEIISKHQVWLKAYGKYNVIKDRQDIDYEDYLTAPSTGFMACVINKDLSDLDFFEANLKFSIFKGCNLQGSNLYKVDFTNACLVGSNFNKANLNRTNLQDANLANTSFIETKFGA